MMIMLDKIKSLKDISSRLRPIKSDSQDSYLVGLDIGTEYVKVLIARQTPDGAEIIGVGRAHQELSDMQAGAIADISGVVTNCEAALHQAEQQAGVQARTTVIGIAGELVQGLTLTMVFQRKDPSISLDMPEMEVIIRRCQERALERAKKQLALEVGGREVELKLVNSAIISMMIDGYVVTNPIGFQGKDVKIQMYSAFAPLVHISALERTAEQLDLDLLAVAAEPFAVGRAVIGDDPNATLSAILMDVGGGTTDIAVLNEGGLQGTKMFGIGGRAFTKSVARDLNIEFTEAESLKVGLASGQVPAVRAEEIKTSLQKTLDVWIDGIELALSEYTHLDHLPHRILLCGGGASLGMIPEQLSTKTWYSELPFTRKPVIQHLSPDQVVGIIDQTGKVKDHTYITAMGLLRVGCDTIGQADIPKSGIKDKFNKLLSV